MEKLTHWKKNNDPRYISGEDLKDGLEIGKGLSPEMVVMIDRFEDSETFDKKKQETIIKTGLWLKDLNGNKLYKPVILNNTNAEFFIKEMQSKYLEHWLNKPCVLYAKPDSRHGFVSRFKKYFPPAALKPDAAIAKLSAATDLTKLGEIWASLTAEEKKLPQVMAKKEELKKSLSTS